MMFISFVHDVKILSLLNVIDCPNPLTPPPQENKRAKRQNKSYECTIHFANFQNCSNFQNLSQNLSHLESMELSKMGYKMATIIMENNIVMLNLLVRF